MDEWGINHQRITPLWLQANSEAENFMKPLSKSIRVANVEGRDWKKELHIFLLNYQATPHATTGFSPAELLFNREIKTNLPQIVSRGDPERDTVTRERDEKAKDRMKEYADQKQRAAILHVKIGDIVLVRQKKQNKFSTRFDPAPFRVT